MATEVEIEAFRVGPASRGITVEDLDQAVAAYNAETDPAPLVVGHPTSDKPAHGIIAKVRRDGAKLFTTLKDISEDAVKGVKENRFINRSIAFWHPEHPSNPTPGKWNIRHLGLLGASSPGIPSMSKLAFNADETVIESTAEPATAVIFTAEKVDGTETTTITETNVPNPKDGGETVAKTEFDALKAERDQFKAAADAAAEARENDRKKGNAEFVDKMVSEGRLLPGHKSLFVELFNRLPVEEVQFDADTKGTLDAELRKVLAAASPQIVFEAISPNGDAKDRGTMNAEQIRAVAHQMVKDGKAVNFEAAVAIIDQQQGK